MIGGLYVTWLIERPGEVGNQVRTDAVTGFDAIVMIAGLRKTGVQCQIVTADRQTAARVPVSKYWRTLAEVLAVEPCGPTASVLLPCRQ